MSLPVKDPEKRAAQIRAWKERGAERYQENLRERLKNGEVMSGLSRETPINPRNRDRQKKLYAKQFGPKGDAMKGMPCWVTGDEGLGFYPVDNAHVDGTRGAGADSSMLARLRRDVHRSFDLDTDAVFETKWGTSKDYVRDQAREFEMIWQARKAEQERTLEEQSAADG